MFFKNKQLNLYLYYYFNVSFVLVKLLLNAKCYLLNEFVYFCNKVCDKITKCRLCSMYTLLKHANYLYVVLLITNTQYILYPILIIFIQCFIYSTVPYKYSTRYVHRNIPRYTDINIITESVLFIMALH